MRTSLPFGPARGPGSPAMVLHAVADDGPRRLPEPGPAPNETDFCRLLEAIRRERAHARGDSTCPDGCCPAIILS